MNVNLLLVLASLHIFGNIFSNCWILQNNYKIIQRSIASFIAIELISDYFIAIIYFIGLFQLIILIKIIIIITNREVKSYLFYIVF